MTILRFNELNKDKINYSFPEKTDTYYLSSIGYNDNMEPIYLQTPNSSFSLDDEFKYIDIFLNDKDTKEFSELINELDNKNVNETHKNSEEWFNKDLPLDAIRDMYKFSNNNDNKLRFKIPNEDGKVQCSIYNNERVYIDINELKELNRDTNNKIILILHLKGLRILKTKFYFDVYISQIKICSNKKYNILSKYSLIDDKNNEEDENEDDIFNEEISKVKIENDRIDEIKRLEEELKKKKSEINYFK